MQGRDGPRANFPRSAHRHSWTFAIAAAVGVMIVGLVLVSNLPQSVQHLVSSVALVLSGLALAAVCRYRFHRNSGRRRRAWLLFSLAALCGALGNAWVSLMGYSDSSAPVPLGEISLLTALLLGIAGLVTYPSVPRRGTDLTRMVLDGVVLGGSALLIASDTLFPQILDQSGDDWARVFSLAVPVIDLILATVGWLLFTRGSRTDRPALAMAATGFALFAISDGLAAAQGRAFTFGSVVDLGWIAGYALLTLGVSWSVAPLPEGVDPPPEHSAVAGTMVMFGLLIAAAFVHLYAAGSGTTSTSSNALLILVLLAVSARQTLLTLDNEVLRRGLEQRVLERSTELREVTQRTDLLVDSVADGVYGVDDEGSITFVNPAAVQALGFRRSEILGRNAHTLFHDHGVDHHSLHDHSLHDHSLYENSEAESVDPSSDGKSSSAVSSCYLSSVISDRVSVRGLEDAYRDASGRQIPVEVTASPLASDARAGGAVVVFRDVTQRREVDRLKDEFVSMVSHELRTPLTAIRGSLGLLAGGALGELKPPATRMVEIALDSSRRLTRLIDQILDLERIESGKLPLEIGEHSAAQLIDTALDQMRIIAEAAKVTIVATSTDGVVTTDADRVVQTLLNLLGNAVKFSAPGGQVVVSSVERSDTVEFRIDDRGRGIPEDKLEIIFARFEQVDSSDAREKGGSGLGLAISRSLVERLGGHIWAEHRRGGGSRFSFVLPRVLEQPDDTERHPFLDHDMTDGNGQERSDSTQNEVREVESAGKWRQGR
jgi:PAS domain S-box-containing protein